MDFDELLTAVFPLTIDPGDLRHGKSRALAVRLLDRAYAAGSLVECRSSQDSTIEAIVADLQIELGQRALQNDIRSVERVVIVLDSDDAMPSVRSLRADFPDVPHLNMPTVGEPKSLCLYDVAWSDIAAGWTAKVFLERIRWWFSATAYGELHGDQQPLEPVMSTSSFRLIVADGIADKATAQGIGIGGEIYIGDDQRSLFLFPKDRVPGDRAAKLNCVVVTVVAPPREHGRIATGPGNVGQLLALLEGLGIDLSAELTTLISNAVGTAPDDLKKHLMVVVTFPVARSDAEPVEEGQTFAFLVPKPLGEIGVDLGVLAVSQPATTPPTYGLLLGDRHLVGQLPVAVLEVFQEFSSSVAKLASGLGNLPLPKTLLVGAGAIGSRIADNLARAGVAEWDVVDEDVLLPHNLARHALDGFAVGTAKAVALARHLADLLNRPIGRAILANFLKPGSAADHIEAAISEAGIVLDASASVPVSRSIAIHPGVARAVAMFMNPRATDLVCLVEDKGRRQNLATLEHYYLRAVMDGGPLDGHLSVPTKPGFRYGTSCRNPSVQVLGSQVSVLAGLGASLFIDGIQGDAALARVWRLEVGIGSVAVVDIEVGGEQSGQFAEWNVHVLDAAHRDMRLLRLQRLPNETGGVLIGSIDRVQKSLFVVAALPAPSDSEERTSSFIRGVARLRERVQMIAEVTAGQLEYIGEWHSHPPGHPNDASGLDKKLYDWVVDELDETEAPPLMAIVGDEGLRVHARVANGGPVLDVEFLLGSAVNG